MAKELDDLTKAEWVVMKCCWRRGKCTAREVYDEVGPKKDWQYQTVKTMLDRLVQKGYLKLDKVGPICVFAPAVPQSKVAVRALDSFVSNVLDGTLAPLFAHLAKGPKLSDEEVATLKKLLEQHEEDI
ncbi:MAG: BlaI/MecI/CopY family transcriptional regulator [Candidatus Hydrogenedentes bacterium]|nr:BlaI/MecI/CopY family transcriptional regulator [Candidatus Hydrogenedentota bacterium]